MSRQPEDKPNTPQKSDKTSDDNGVGPNVPPNLNEAMNEAGQRAQKMARDAQGNIQASWQAGLQNTQDKMRDAQDRARDAQERALSLARQRAQEAQEAAQRANEAMPPGLLMRLIVSIAGIPILLLFVFAEGLPQYPALPFAGAVAICAVRGGWEFFTGLRLRGFVPSEGAAFVAIALLQLAAWGVSRGLLTAFLPVLLAVLVIATLIHQISRHDPEPIANIGATFFGVIYVGWLFSYLIFLRSLPGVVHILPFTALPLPFSGWFESRGAWLVLYVFAVTWSTDAGAYFVGMRLGKTPLAPRLSPKKTREGAMGGLVAATLMSLVWGHWIGLPTIHCLLLGPVLGALGQIGDLCESAIKRDLGIKDFGTLLPGHGGILDRFDSLLFTAPIAYYYLIFVLPHVW